LHNTGWGICHTITEFDGGVIAVYGLGWEIPWVHVGGEIPKQATWIIRAGTCDVGACETGATPGNNSAAG